MRILLLCDMEGVSGIQSWEHVGGNTPLYEEGRRLYTEEVNAAVRGCLAGGATSVVAHDGHGGAYQGCRSFMNWIPDRLHPGAEYVRGYRWACYVAPLESGECDAVAFVGAHARAGQERGVLAHTISSEAGYVVRLNGQEVSESCILAAIAGSFGVPAICISGDQLACDELEEFVGAPIITAPVKRGLGPFGARMLAPSAACALIESRFREAVADRTSWPRPVAVPESVVISVQAAVPERIGSFARRKGVTVVDERTVQARGSTFWEAWSLLWSPA